MVNEKEKGVSSEDVPFVMNDTTTRKRPLGGGIYQIVDNDVSSMEDPGTYWSARTMEEREKMLQQRDAKVHEREHLKQESK